MWLFQQLNSEIVFLNLYPTHQFSGVVVDVGKLLSQLERSEQARFDAESRLSATNKILSSIRDAEGKQTAIKEKLQVRLD